MAVCRIYTLGLHLRSRNVPGRGHTIPPLLQRAGKVRQVPVSTWLYCLHHPYSNHSFSCFCAGGNRACSLAQIRYGGSYHDPDLFRRRLHSPKNTPCVEDSLDDFLPAQSVARADRALVTLAILLREVPLQIRRGGSAQSLGGKYV